MKGITIASMVLLAIIQFAMCQSSTDPKVFFPDIKGNLTKIRWAHGVNSQAKLEKALQNDDIMMLEADVVLGKLNTSTGNATIIPIMAHPPANESDLSLEKFINAVQNASKGIKLDFKTIEAFEQSKSILSALRKNLSFPVFINADILPGPVNATNNPVDAKRFLTGATQTIPEGILSIGWTTRYGKEDNITEGRYTTVQIQQMLDTVSKHNVSQPITYPVRAGLAANDLDTMKKLLEKSASDNATLTIWSSDDDVVDAKKLSSLIMAIGVDRVYVDVPDVLWRQLNISGATGIASTSLMNFGALVMTLILSRML